MQYLHELMKSKIVLLVFNLFCFHLMQDVFQALSASNENAISIVS